MYLTAKRFYWFNEAKPQVEGVPAGYEVQEISVPAAYWRKANQIHAWFVDNVQEGEDQCREHEVSRDQLRELIEICKTVTAGHKKAPDLLPARSGFFFGGTEYDKWFFEDVRETVEKLTPLLDEDKFPTKDWDFYYRSSW